MGRGGGWGTAFGGRIDLQFFILFTEVKVDPINICHWSNPEGDRVPWCPALGGRRNLQSGK